ncbi:MAG: hypothetical protein ACE5F9_12360 [Phycisphaerae bacterium]
MRPLPELLGVECGLDDLNRALRGVIERGHPPVIGAMHITCSDESERECIDAFQKHFADRLLPELKFGSRSPFRTSNLGGRYEWGAIRIAEQHFAVPASRDSFKTIVVKINAHVAVRQDGEALRFGPMDRYRADSVACGALHALLDGVRQPYTDELREAFASEGMDRLALLNDPDRVDPANRSLFAAIANARMQARHVILDIQDHRSMTPTVYIVAACVTFNRPGPDTELFCGYYHADCRGDDPRIEYRGLSDDPSKYRLGGRLPRLRVEGEHLNAPRPARDHRRLVAELWRRRKEASRNVGDGPVEGAPAPAAAVGQEPRFAKIAEELRDQRHHDHPYAKAMLRSLIDVLLEVSPVPAALVLFAEGLGAMYHAHRMHHLVRDSERHADAQRLLVEVRDRIDQLPPERVREVIGVLLAEYGA